jgi:NADP-dependent 3-hydroxy acid dehydrogenase YdfG
MSKQFDGSVVWITGGGSGLGRGMALCFAREGASVIVSGRRQERLTLVAGEIDEAGGAGVAMVCDVTDEAEVQATVDSIVDRFGRLDVVVANAGFAVGGKIENISADEWRRQLDVNVVGLALTARAALPALRLSRGRVALVGSVAGTVTSPGSGAYCASKYAVRAIGQTLSMELHGTGVTCTTIQPGFVASEIAQVDNDGVHDSNRRDKRPAKLMWPTDKAARVMVDAIRRRRREFTFTFHGLVASFAGRHTPGFVHWVTTRNR